ncbi:unnamed protein product [Ascophyllum nodosum]
MTFRVPVRAIRTLADLNHFQNSKTYSELMAFIRLCNDAVMGVRISSLQHTDGGSESVGRIVGMLQQMATWVDDIPPIDEPMRFGNKAFRQWYQKLEEKAGGMVDSILQGSAHEAATIELVPYLLASFGDPTRIDYGTGHETTFVVWLCCLYKLGSLSKDDLASAVLKIFHSYLQVMRRLQSVYMLEPAGSHGVWGLDDYHCLPFLWGSAQLIDHPTIKPLDVLDEDKLTEGKEDYLYLGAIAFIRSLKKGAAFGECCPMLSDIANLPSWRKVNSGMLRLYQGDVLGKMPVIQHFLFGSILPCTWEPSAAPTHVPGVAARAPWAQRETPRPTSNVIHDSEPENKSRDHH